MVNLMEDINQCKIVSSIKGQVHVRYGKSHLRKSSFEGIQMVVVELRIFKVLLRSTKHDPYSLRAYNLVLFICKQNQL